MANQKQNLPSQFGQLGVFMTIPFVLALPPIVTWYLGKKCQEYFLLEPWIVYLFIAIGLASGFRELYRIIKTYGDNS